MATAQNTMTRLVTDDATFRAEARKLSDLIAACGGIVKTADTGQIDFATVTKPAVINTAAGYEIYRFADALQATMPVFIKIEYGSGGAASGNSLTHWVTIGTASNGSGTLTGQVTTRQQMATPTNAGSGSPTIYVSTQTNRLFVHWSQAANLTTLIVVERPRDTAGTEVADQAILIASNSGASTLAVLPLTGAVPAFISWYFIAGLPPALQPGATSGTDFAVSSMTYAWKGKWWFVLGVIYAPGQFVAYTPTSLTLLGASRALLPTEAVGWGFGSTCWAAFGYS